MQRVCRTFAWTSALLLMGCYEGGEKRLYPGDFGSDGAVDAGSFPDLGNDGGTSGAEGSGGSGSGDSGSGDSGADDPSTSGDSGSDDPSTSSDSGSGDPSTSGDSGTGDPSTSGDSSTGDPSTSGDSGTPPPPADDDRIARDISLTTVSVNQAVEISVGNGTQVIPVSSRNARIVQDRDTLVRARWQVQSGFTTRSLEGRLSLTSGGNTTVYTDTRTVSSTGSANPSSYNGTFRWAVPGAAIQPGTSFSVGLYEIDDSLNGTPLPSTPPRLPSSGEVSLGVDNDTYEIDVVLVPIRWVYGGNDRTPNLNATNVETIRRTIWERNPAAQINISVRSQPVLWNNAISLEGILQTISQTKDQDNAPNGTYYEGLADFGCFAVIGSQCSNGGGTTGLGYVTSADSWASAQRASISVFYNVDSSAQTLTHELGHNQGRNHAPCGGVSSYDPNYPYNGGTIGVYGHKLGTSTIYSPSSTYDFMGYCDPSWTSDWTWERLATRNALLTVSAPLPDDPGTLLQGVIGEDGREHWITIEGTLPAEAVTHGHFMELWGDDDLIARVPAYRGRIGESEAQVIVIQLPDALAEDADLTEVAAAVLEQHGLRTPLSLDLLPAQHLESP